MSDTNKAFVLRRLEADMQMGVSGMVTYGLMQEGAQKLHVCETCSMSLLLMKRWFKFMWDFSRAHGADVQAGDVCLSSGGTWFKELCD
eukprot:385443-Pelagomonas_calceolata.AAC.8